MDDLIVYLDIDFNFEIKYDFRYLKDIPNSCIFIEKIKPNRFELFAGHREETIEKAGEV